MSSNTCNTYKSYNSNNSIKLWYVKYEYCMCSIHAAIYLYNRFLSTVIKKVVHRSAAAVRNIKTLHISSI